MKKNHFLFLLTFATTNLISQTYFDINFASTSGVLPQTILVNNLTKGTNVSIQGTDTLRLNIITSVQRVEIEKSKLKIYPSPMEQNCFVEFQNVQQGKVYIQMFTMDGKLLYQSSRLLPQGKHIFRISGVSEGIHVLSIKTTTEHLTGHFVAKGQPVRMLDMMPITEISGYNPGRSTVKSNSSKQNIQAEFNSSVVNMDYTPGDNLSFLGSTDGYVNQTIYASPTGSQSLTFMLTQVVEVYNPATGKTWMDRNLGASRVATSIMDYQAYGDLYQWGRGTDGHEKRDSPITSTLSIGDTPGHGSFITIYDYIYDINDWRSSRNSNLWQGVIGTNNPCPDGFRIPTIAEWDAEISYWSSRDYYGAFGSPLRLPAAGTRGHISGGVFIDSYGYYWSSTVYGSHRSQFLRFFAQSAYASYFIYRANGYSVRCIKD